MPSIQEEEKEEKEKADRPIKRSDAQTPYPPPPHSALARTAAPTVVCSTSSRNGSGSARRYRSERQSEMRLSFLATSRRRSRPLRHDAVCGESTMLTKTKPNQVSVFLWRRR